jgi:beta-glucosidase/6-phospho-beta-glucosidase/beta-galactosidase
MRETLKAEEGTEMPAGQTRQIFRSFWMAGFESSCHINASHRRLDMIAGVHHDLLAATDYALIRDVGMLTARDGIRWHLVDRSGGFDFSSLVPLADAADKAGVQVIWNLCHYGWPDDLDIFTPKFVDRFARFSSAVAAFFFDRSEEVPVYAPVNEISFFAWAAGRQLIYPYAYGRGAELKEQLVRAVIAGCEAIWSVDRRARFVYPEPTIHCVPLRSRPDWTEPAAIQNESQFEAWDMIAGYARPDLGGHPRYLDILGSNFYFSNQWECPDGDRIAWHIKPRDERWVPYHRLLENIHRRYRRPLFVAETSHIGSGRGEWVLEIAREVQQARSDGTPIEGVCLYPIIDRYDWNDDQHWHNSGLWDLQIDDNGVYRRILNQNYRSALQTASILAGEPLSSA